MFRSVNAVAALWRVSCVCFLLFLVDISGHRLRRVYLNGYGHILCQKKRLSTSFWLELNTRQVLAKPLLSQLVQLSDLIGFGKISFASQGPLGASIHHLQLDLAVPRCIKDKAHRIGNALVVVNHFVAVDDVARLMAGQLLLQIVDGDVLDVFVNANQLLLTIDFHLKLYFIFKITILSIMND